MTVKRRGKTVKWSFLVLIGVLLATLAGLSVVTTFAVWDGTIPSGRFRITVRDLAGRPIEGAKLSVYERTGFFQRSEKPAYATPIHEFDVGRQPESPSDGVIEASHVSPGLEIGGGAFALFWLIPIDWGGPEYVVAVNASGYREVRFEYKNLYLDCDDVLRVLAAGRVPICEYEVTLLAAENDE